MRKCTVGAKINLPDFTNFKNLTLLLVMSGKKGENAPKCPLLTNNSYNPLVIHTFSHRYKLLQTTHALTMSVNNRMKEHVF